MALTGDKNIKHIDGDFRSFLCKVNESIYKGALVCLDGSNVAVKAATATGLKAVGVAEEQIMNAGAETRVRVRSGKVFCFKNSSGADEITLADIDADAYIVDDETVAKTSATNTRSVGGKIFDVNSYGVWVKVGG